MIFIDKNFIAIALDFPAHTENQLSEDQQEHNEKMAEIYNKNGSFPLIIVLDSDGIEIGTIKGYLREGSDKFLNKLTSIIEK
jgi:thioredoxin-related protein